MSMKTLLLLNHPRTQKALTVSETSTVKDFRAAVAKTLDLPLSKLESCAVVCVKYGKAPYSLDLNAMEEEETKVLAKKEKNSKVMKDFLMDGCVLSFQYPVTYARPKKEEKIEETKEEATSDEDETVRFKGLTKSTIISLLIKNEKAILAAAASESGKKKSSATAKKSRAENMLDFFDIHSLSLFKKIENDNKFWTKISPALLRALLARDTLSASEIYIMKALLVWGEAHLTKPKKSLKSSSSSTDDDEETEKKSEEEEDPSSIELPEVTEELKKVVGDYIKYIRFPTMPMTLIAGCITSSNLLSQQQLLDLFQYCSMRPKDEDETTTSTKKTKTVSLPSSLSIFSAKKRVPAESSSDWKFDATINPTYYTVSDKGKTIKRISSESDWKSVPVTKWIKSGVQKIKFKIEQFPASGYMEIGLVFKGFSNYGYYLGQGDQSLSWQCDYSSSSVIYYNSSSTSYGTKYKTGDIVEMIVDMNKHELRFNLNGVSQGTARTSLPSEVCPAICTYSASGSSIKIM
eukprot:TRINITY_DN348_c0_g2_i1.p1 TRINITY_DN348_c0_g2~~TRINITY_DN348_c0_g2_i1.p1  ORF type:complete len:547 (-),score=147.19 TRINITY_DN348_c0_g2_i1:38-1594(-)